MSIFGKIKDAIFGSAKAKEAVQGLCSRRGRDQRAIVIARRADR